MANPNDPDAIAVSVVLDPETTAAISKALEGAVTKGAASGFRSMSKFFKDQANLASTLRPLQTAVNNVFDPKTFSKATKGLEGFTKELTDILGKLKGAGGIKDPSINKVLAGTTRLAAEQATKMRQIEISERRQTLAERKALDAQGNIDAQRNAQRQNILLKQAGQERLQNERAVFDQVGREERSQNDLRLTQARSSARMRIAITKGMVEGIIMLEKGLGTAISGIAHTTVSAFSKAFSGLGSLFKRNNQEITQGLDSALNKRESIMRESFHTQERIVNSSITKQEKQLTELRTIASRGVTGAITGRGIGFGIGGLIAGIGIGSILKAGLTDATNFTEQMNKNTVVFGDFADGVVAFAKTSVNALGTTHAAALQATGTFGNLFRAVGIDQAPAAQMSVRLTQLAADLSSFNNVPVEEAFQAIQSGLVGEQEPLRKFGVNLNEATLKAKAMELGLSDGKGVLDANAKAQAAYALILEQTTLAQGDFARTADEGANAARRAKASVAQFASTLMSKVKPALTTLENAIVPFFESLTALVSGENLSAGMQLLRDGLIGAAAGLTAIIAAKAAVEVFQLLGLAIQFALTPMGLLIIGAAAIGAAFKILIERSETFRTAVDNIKTKLGDAASALMDVLVPAFETVIEFIQTTIIPALISFAGYIGDHLVNAIRRTINFITGTAIPALREFASFVADKLAPVVKAAGEFIGNAFQFAKDKLQEFFAFIKPLIQPAIDGFEQLGQAVGDAFRGNFSNLASGFAAAGRGIAQAAANIGVAIFNALKPIGEKIVSFFKDLFTVDSLKSVYSAFLDLVEFIGRTIGSIASNPNVVRAVAAVAAALAIGAVQIGYRFVKGLFEGIGSNLGGLVDLLIDTFLTLLKAAFNPSIIIPVIIAGFALTRLVGPLISAFKGLGTQSAASFTTGFKTGLVGAGGFLQGLFSGAGSTGLSQMQKANKIFSKEVQATQNQLRILGSTTIVQPHAIDAAKAELKRLKGGFTDAQIAGLQFRDRINGAFTAIGGTVRQLGKAIGAGFSGSLTGVRNAFAGLANGLRDVAAEQGQKVGVYFGKAVGVGMLAAVGGFAAGQAGGRAGVNPLVTALTTGIAASALTGGNPIVGVVAGGAALIGSAFGDAARKAAEFQAKVKDLTSALETDLGPALKDATGKVLTLKDALAGADKSNFVETLFNQIGQKNLNKLGDIGINLGEIVRAFEGGDAAVAALIQRITELGGVREAAPGVKSSMPLLKKQIDAIAAAYKATSQAIDGVNAKQRQFASVDILSKADLATQRHNAHIVELAGVYGELANGVKGLPAPDVAPTTKAIATVDEKMKGLQGTIDLTAIAMQELFAPGSTTFTQFVNSAILQISGLGSTIQTAFDALNAGTGNATVNKAQMDDALATFGQSVTEVVQKGVDDGLITTPEQAAQFALPLLDSLLSGVTDPNLRAIITDTFNKALAALQPLIDQEAAAHAALLMSEEFQTFLDEHPFDIELRGADAAAQAAADATAYLIEHPVVPGIQPNTKGAREAAKLMLAEIVAEFGLTKGQAYQLGIQLATGLAQGMDAGTIEARNAAQRLADTTVHAFRNRVESTSPSKVFMEIGGDITEGLVIGIIDTMPAVRSAIGTSVSDAIHATAVRVSREVATLSSDVAAVAVVKAYDIGQAISEGIRDGVKDGVEDIASLVSSVLDNAVNSVLNKANSSTTAIRSAVSGLFGLTVGPGAIQPGGGSASGLGDAQGAFTQALQGISSTFDSVVSAFFDANRALGEGKGLTSAQQDLIGENVFGLSTSQTSGVQNRAALVSAFNAISEVGQQLLASGAGPQMVADQLNAMVFQVEQLTDSLGINKDEVMALADAFGLSGPALQNFINNANAAAGAAQLAADALAANAAASGAASAAATDPHAGEAGHWSRDEWIPDPPDPGEQDFTLAHLPRPIVINLYPQHGDPTAIALDVANKIAQEVGTPR